MPDKCLTRAETEAPSTVFDVTVSSLCGFIIGYLAGLVGIGGGEYRAPVLVYVLRLGMKVAVACNLLIGLIVVSVSFARRLDSSFTSDLLLLSVIMVPFSVLGSYFGAKLTQYLNETLLKRALGVLLLVAAGKVFLDSFSFTAKVFEFSPLALVATAVSGLGIGLISGLLGVAGGEFRIPALMFIFGLPIKLAGTVNLLISIPTVLSGFIKHHRLGHTNKRAIYIAVLMSLFSVAGALAGAALFLAVESHVLMWILALLMAGVGVKMIFKP